MNGRRRITLPRRAAGISAAAGLLALTLVSSPAQAATCVNVPGSTPGTNVTIAGDDYRVPSISNISVCTHDGSVPLVGVELQGGNCTAACLAVVLLGGDVDPPGVTISYRVDGVTTSTTIDPGPLFGGPAGTCLLGVGSPEAPRSDCFFAIEPDDGAIGDAEELVCRLLERTGLFACPLD
jgi:hypothetical protein